MGHLPAELSALLSPAERIAYAVAERANRGTLTKRAATAYLRHFPRRLVSACSRNLLHVAGLENLTALAPDRGVLVASNHRSFFDLYVISDQMLRSCPWVDSLYFPVRSEFFYTRASGTLVNAAMSALAMYPPIFRDPAKRPLNEHAVQVLKSRCTSPGALIGIHPEGKRGTGDDPYAMLPPKAGTGEIVFHAKPIVLPVFLLGISNSLVGQLEGNQRKTGEPITVCYGKPLDLSAYFDRPAEHATYLAISAAVCDAIADLGRQERELRRERGLPPPRSYRVKDVAEDLRAKGAASPRAPRASLAERDPVGASSSPPSPPA
jgi:1-acyl-sn-glycerol-3-phosphate acyltransferase